MITLYPEVDLDVQIYAQTAIFEQITTKKANTISATDEYHLFVIVLWKSSVKKNYEFYGVYFPGQLPPGELQTEPKHRVYLISLPPGINCHRISKFTGELIRYARVIS